MTEGSPDTSLAAYLAAISEHEVIEQLPDGRWRCAIPVLAGWVVDDEEKWRCRSRADKQVITWVAQHVLDGVSLPMLGNHQPVITDVTAPMVYTDRLRLVPCTATLTAAATFDHAALAWLLGVRVHPAWPYPEVSFDDDDEPDDADADAVGVVDSAAVADVETVGDEPPWSFMLHVAWTLTHPATAPWLWMIVHTQDNTLIGEIGTLNPLQPTDTEDNVQIGYSLVPDYQGRGYMTEAARAYVAWAFTHPELHWIFATTTPDNVRSQRVLEKLGARQFRDDDEVDYPDRWLDWELLPEDFAKAIARR